MQAFRRIILIAVLMSLALPFSAFAQSDLLDLDGRVITVAVEPDYRPFNFTDEMTGELAGWDYDALAEICARLNCALEFAPRPWEGMLQAVSDGEYDLTGGGIIITEERKEIVAFSDGYADVSQRIIVRAGEDRFASADEFIAGDYMIGVQVASVNSDVAGELVGEDRLAIYDSVGDAIDDVIAGDLDAMMTDSVAGYGYVSANAEAIRMLPDALSAKQLGLTFPLDSDLVGPFNAALASMAADGALAAINSKWLGTELPDLGGRTVTVAVENAYIPFNFIDEDSGEPDGWDYDALAEICARLNCVPEYIEQSWEGMIVAVSNGEYDLAAGGITVTDERKEIVAFSDGYIDVAQRMMVQLGEDRFASVADFVEGDYIIGVQIATTNYNAAKDLVGEDRLVGYETFGFAVQALIAGDVDAVVMDDVAGQGYVGVNAEDLRLLPEALTSEELAFIYSLDSDLVGPFNAALASMKADGALIAINRKWGLMGGEAEEEAAALPDLGGRTVTVAVENAYIPFNFIDEDTGEPDGWDYDALAEICARLNCVPEYIEQSWEGMIVAVSNGEYDLAAGGITVTDERKEIVAFSDGYIDVAQRMMVQLGEDRFASVADFVEGDYIIGVQIATTNYNAAKDLVGEDRLVGYETFGFAVQALIAGDVDAVVMDDVAGQGYVGVNAEDLRLLPEALTSEELAFIYSLDSDLVGPFNAALASMRADGALMDINRKWGLMG